MKQLSSTLICLFTLIYILLSTQLHSQTGWFSQVSSIDLPIRKIFFINENTGWASSEGGYTFISGGHLIRTTNGGQNWITVLQGYIAFSSFCFLDQNTGWLTGGFFDDIGNRVSYIFKTTNCGLNWFVNYADSIITGYRYIKFVNESIGIVSGGSDTAFILKTINTGNNWLINFYPECRSIDDFTFINSSTGWAIAGYEGYVFKSTDFGSSLTRIFSYPGTYFRSIFFIDSSKGWICGNNGLILKTTNGGFNWFNQNAMLTSHLNSILFCNPDTGWCAGINGNILYTSNGGINWIQQASNTSDDLKSIYFLNPSTGWAAGGLQAITGYCTILKTTTGGLIPVRPLGEKIPEKYYLHQNYPNPFNPVTNIKYAVPKYVSNLKLIIYDVLSGEKSVLVDESNVNPGDYEVTWDASNYASGVYFYRLITDEYSETRKMVLIK